MSILVPYTPGGFVFLNLSRGKLLRSQTNCNTRNPTQIVKTKLYKKRATPLFFCYLKVEGTLVCFAYFKNHNCHRKMSYKIPVKFQIKLDSKSVIEVLITVPARGVSTRKLTISGTPHADMLTPKYLGTK